MALVLVWMGKDLHGHIDFKLAEAKNIKTSIWMTDSDDFHCTSSVGLLRVKFPVSHICAVHFLAKL